MPLTTDPHDCIVRAQRMIEELKHMDDGTDVFERMKQSVLDSIPKQEEVQ